MTNDIGQLGLDVQQAWIEEAKHTWDGSTAMLGRICLEMDDEVPTDTCLCPL